MKEFFFKIVNIVLYIIFLVILLILNIILLPFRLILMLYRRFFPSAKHDDLTDKVKIKQDGDILNINCDELDDEEQKLFRSALIDELELQNYKGSVKHAYDTAFVKTTDSCPRCSAMTRQCFANFIYIVDQGLRVMYTPAGYFCTKCPTVIIDQEMIKGGVQKKFKFKSVIGINYDDDREDDDYFKTWNGEERIFLADEEENRFDVISVQAVAKSRQNIKAKSRKRKKMAKRSKKKNRKK